MKNIKNIFIFIIFISISSFLEARSSTDYNWMINTINHQKILTQQILKEYAFLGMGNSFRGSKKSFKEYLKKYDKELKELGEVLLDDKAVEYLYEVNQIWLPIQKTFNSPPKKSEVADLQKRSDKILDRMSKLMRIVLSKSSKEINKIVSISGYQNVIIERMGALYMLKTWGIDDHKFKFKMRESITFFKNSLYKMLNSRYSTPNIKIIIKKVMNDFKKRQIMNRSKTKFIPILIYDKTNEIHTNMNKITRAYIEKER